MTTTASILQIVLELYSNEVPVLSSTTSVIIIIIIIIVVVVVVVVVIIIASPAPVHGCCIIKYHTIRYACTFVSLKLSLVYCT